jgi:adenosylcobinamide kinase / adenosylcobinamide-phosphate guanylyltransferase
VAKIIFITGGQRSGKSKFAQNLAEKLSDNPIYLATARIWDEEFRRRVERHQSDRGENWLTIEEEKHIGSLSFAGKTVLMDCVTLWLTNLFTDNEFQVEPALSQAKTEFQNLANQPFTLIVVSNELGMGIIPDNLASRQFLDLQGWANQFIASLANEVYLMVSGIPVKVK